MESNILARERARAALEPITPLLRAGFRQVLVTPLPRLNLPWNAAEFEVCPMFFGVVAIPLDEPILPDLEPDLIPGGVLDDEATFEVFGDVMMEWLAETWEAAGGDKFPYPGRAFFHGYSERYDFRTRTWLDD